MKHIKNALFPFVGLLLIFLAVTALIPALTKGQKSDLAPPQPKLDVKVINTTSEPVPIAGTINIGNPGTNPVPVRDVDNPARQPVQINESYTVPDGKRLVIEYISFGIEGASECDLLITSLSASGTLLHLYHPTFVGIFPGGPGSAGYRYVLSQETRAYVGPNRTVTLSIRSYAGCIPDLAHAAATGYLVDM